MSIQNGAIQVSDKTVRFLGVEMAEETAAKLAQVDDGALAKQSDSIDKSVERDETDTRLEPFIGRASVWMTKQLAQNAITPADLSRIRWTMAEDGKCYAEYAHAGRGRTGNPSDRFGGFTQSVLKAHNVKRFVKLGKHNKIVDEADDGAGICRAEHIPFAGQAQNGDADNNHVWAGCDRQTCTVACHGDNANRVQTYDRRKTLGESGWSVEYNDGKRANLATLEWHTNSNNGASETA